MYTAYTTSNGSHNLYRVVRFLLPPTYLLLRRTSTLWQASVRFRGLACWLQRGIPVRKYRRLICYQQGALRRLPGTTCLSGRPNGSCRVFDNVGVWVLTTSLCYRCWSHSLRQCAYRSDKIDPLGRDTDPLHGHERPMLRPLLQITACTV